MADKQTLVLVDGSSLAFRSFFALISSNLRRTDGAPTWAVYGFFQSLFELIEKRTPDCIAVSFDLSAPTFRHEEFQDYKAHRQEMPDDLSVQWPVIKEGVKVLGIPVYELAGYEADDVIGTVAKEAEQRGMGVTILTGDQDAFQLLDETIRVLMPSRDGLQYYGRQEVFNKLQVWPEQITDYKGLCGDSSDNIPGVKGIGPKTAVQLLSQYQTVEGIYENIDKISSASVRKKLEEGKESAFHSKRLATIRVDVPIDFDFDHCKLCLPPVDEVVSYFRRIESNAILKRLPKILSMFNGGVAPEIAEELLHPIGKPLPGKSSLNKSSTGSAGYSKPAPTTEPVPAGAGAVAVAQQQKLALVHETAAVSLPPVAPEIITDEQRLQQLVMDLATRTLLGVKLITDCNDSCNAEIVGYALAWNDSARLSELNRPDLPANHGATQTAYIPLGHSGTAQVSKDVAHNLLRPILTNAAIGKVAYNGKFELNAASLVGTDIAPLVFDPMLASYIVNPDDSHKLRDIAMRCLGYGMQEAADLLGTGKKQLNWTMLPVETAAMYAADSARLAMELSSYYSTRLDDDQQWLLWDMDLPLAAVLAKMEQAGVRLDTDYFDKLSVELKSELTRLETEIFALAGHGFNINSPLQLQKVLFEELKLPPKGKTKSGFSTDASVLEALTGEHAIVAKILEYRQVTKLSSTYVEALPRLLSPRDGRLHGEFNQTTTATGRLSSTNPNLQNIPIRSELGQRIRRGFVGRPGCLIMSADYSQIELRLLAHMSGDEKLIEAFQNNEDIHSRTAMEIFDLKKDELNAEHRRVGKTLNFALIYQQGAFATGQSLGISTKQAQEFIQKYFASYPKVRSFMTQVIEEARRTSYVQTLWGRRRYFRHLNDNNDPVRKADERAACNAPLQGSASDLMKLAMNRLGKELAARNLTSRLILQVHDELVLEVPEAEVDATREAVVAAMSMDQPLRVPLRVDVGVGPNWMDAK